MVDVNNFYVEKSGREGNSECWRGGWSAILNMVSREDFWPGTLRQKPASGLSIKDNNHNIMYTYYMWYFTSF